MEYFKGQLMLSATNGKVVDLDLLKSQKFVLYFYPKDNTSACSLEAMEFAQLYDEFRMLGYHIYGVSKDTLTSHNKFKDKYVLPFTLISDVDKVLLELFDVIQDKKLYGKIVKGTTRSTFIYQENLLLIKEYRNIKAPGHARAVLDFIQGVEYK